MTTNPIILSNLLKSRTVVRGQTDPSKLAAYDRFVADLIGEEGPLQLELPPELDWSDLREGPPSEAETFREERIDEAIAGGHHKLLRPLLVVPAEIQSQQGLLDYLADERNRQLLAGTAQSLAGVGLAMTGLGLVLAGGVTGPHWLELTGGLVSSGVGSGQMGGGFEKVCQGIECQKAREFLTETE